MLELKSLILLLKLFNILLFKLGHMAMIIISNKSNNIRNVLEKFYNYTCYLINFKIT